MQTDMHAKKEKEKEKKSAHGRENHQNSIIHTKSLINKDLAKQ